jgi:hypothetical protein
MMTVPPPEGRGAPPTLDGLPDPRTRRQWASLYVSSALRARSSPAFDDVERFCFFIGYARSGHTLVATLLNAHPEVVVAHELDAVRYVRHRFGRTQLFSLLLLRDQQFGSIGRTWSGYKYEVPDQYQGRFERLRVIGDKRARASVLQIARRPQLLDRFRRVVKAPIRVIHVTRNPFDNIATEVRRHKMSPTQGIEWYEQICKAVEIVRPLLDPDELVDVSYEAFGRDPWRLSPPISTPVPASSGRTPNGPAMPFRGPATSGTPSSASSSATTCSPPTTLPSSHTHAAARRRARPSAPPSLFEPAHSSCRRRPQEPPSRVLPLDGPAQLQPGPAP